MKKSGRVSEKLVSPGLPGLQLRSYAPGLDKFKTFIHPFFIRTSNFSTEAECSLKIFSGYQRQMFLNMFLKYLY